MGVRFLHAADLHLGSSVRTNPGSGPAPPSVCDRAVSTAVERLVECALAEAVDFVIIAGDLYDDDARSVRSNQLLESQFARLQAADIPVYVCYGNHDPVGDAPVYVDLPDNVSEFDAAEPETVAYPDATVPEARIVGQSYRDRHESRSMYRQFTPPTDGVPTVGVLHTALDPTMNRYVPASPGDLASKTAIDYWALGHRHRRERIDRATPLAYPGPPQGRHVGESEVGGALLVTLERDGVESIEFLPTAPVRWEERTVDIGSEGIASVADVERVIRETVTDRDDWRTEFDDAGFTLADGPGSIEATVCRVRLVGNGPVHDTLTDDAETLVALRDRLRQSLDGRTPPLWIESIRDRTGPAVPPIADLADDRVIATFRKMTDTVDDPEMRATFRECVGVAWSEVDDPEEAGADELALTDDRLDALVDRARERVLEELARRRAT